jgi:hypothetical protein
MEKPAARVFQPHPNAQPTVAQGQIGHNSVTNYGTLLSNLGMGLTTQGTLYSSFRPTRQPRFEDVGYFCCGPGVTGTQAAVAAAAGGVVVGGGAALTIASGTTYATLATASVGALGLFTCGVALIVIGVGIAGYYGFEYLHESGGQPPTTVDGMPADEPIADPDR